MPRKKLDINAPVLAHAIHEQCTAFVERFGREPKPPVLEKPFDTATLLDAIETSRYRG